MNEVQYIKGFNSGYTIKRYSPELFDKLSGTMETNNDYLNGFKDGANQRSEEESRYSKGFEEEIDLDKDMLPTQSKDRDKDRDIEK